MKCNYNLQEIGGLIYDNKQLDIITSYEKINTKIFDTLSNGVDQAVNDICTTIMDTNNGGRDAVLVLSSGATMQGVYQELISRYLDNQIDFSRVIVFFLDEFSPHIDNGIKGEQRNLYMQLLNQINIPKENIYDFSYIDGINSPSELCQRYEDIILSLGGIDLAVMGVGERGEIGYNDLGTNVMSKIRMVAINQRRQKYFSNLFNNLDSIPKRAYTFGIKNLLKAKKINILAWSEDKINAVSSAVEGSLSSDNPASFFQLHENCTFIITSHASHELTRVKTPWVVGKCKWDNKFIRKAVVWLCQTVNKPILKLTIDDYYNNSLGELVETVGEYSKINIQVFNDLQHTITGWPGGKKDADDSTRPERSVPYPKRVIIFSPHPDDDVISMGGTAIRLHDQGHEVHIAYQTSGNIAVSDDFVTQVIDTARECGLGDIYDQTIDVIERKKHDEKIEPIELRNLKGSIRRAEAKAACRSFGMTDKTIHFLNQPFYETGGVKKGALTQVDIDIIKKLIKEVEPHQIYAAGDLSDPHGTHRTCIDSIIIALEELKGDKSIADCRLWLYRGAWQEWALDMVDMAVPLSPSEVVKKRHAIFRHASQKDIVPFPGDDAREFWQRAEERTKNTANHYNQLGMAEYEAIEVFVEHTMH